MKKFIVIAAQLGKSGLGTGKLFLTDINGNTLAVNAGFAKSNGIDENYRGLIMYKDEFHTKGSTYTDKDGVQKKYAEDFTKVVSLIPTAKADDNSFMTAYNTAVVKQALEI